jgi:3-isopropylmalate/(R)-2-methylmalate dehydratase large subunit
VGFTLVEKLLMANTGRNGLRPGEIVDVNVDYTMVHDLFAPFVIEKFNEMGFKKVWDPDKIVFVYDHLLPASFNGDVRHHKIADKFAVEQKISRVHRGGGVCHQLMPEKRYATPGKVVFGTDSHTTTYGAVGAFSTGIGYTEMAAIFGTGKIWVKVPGTIKINLEGDLPKGVYAKDLILKILGDIRADGATYKAIEFSGSTIDSMSVGARMTISNMSVEAGAKVGIMAPDEKTCKFSGVSDQECSFLKSDSDATYERVINYDTLSIEPLVACPSAVDNVKKVSAVAGEEIHQAFLGSCTNGRLEDIEIAATIMKDRKVAPYLKFIVTPASRQVYDEAVKAGYISTLIKAGAEITAPTCGLCCGRSGGILADGEKAIASNNRNFIGRMGTAMSEIFLASPATVAASAVTGRITDPREFL